MKKLNLLILSLLFVSCTVVAQTGLKFSLTAIPQLSTILNQNDFDAGQELNFRFPPHVAFGMGVGYNFIDQLGVRLGVLYSQQGGSYINEINKFEWDIKLTYLKLPLMLRYNTKSDATAQFTLGVGPQFGFLSKATNSFSGTDVDVKEFASNTDLALVFAIGSDIRLIEEMLHLNLALRGEYSFSEVEDPKLAGRDKSSNAVVGFEVGVTYTLGFN